MHDRRIDGKAEVFGNAGALYMNAMTWWDHSTESIWSQPWGRAIIGPLKGTELFLLPSRLTTWAAWRQQQPETRVMSNDLGTLGRRRQHFDPDFVIGLILAGEARAYAYRDVADEGAINDFLGPVPVVVMARDQAFHAYVRQVDERVLTFGWDDDGLVDEETGTLWDPARGLGRTGPLAGRGLAAVPSATAYDWAWRDFYPQSSFYEPPP